MTELSQHNVRHIQGGLIVVVSGGALLRLLLSKR